ncbi:MAG: hypothetical protein KQH57_17300 [Actinomycetales bacterium]|nr:hypothetical protein [Actinomycetales bacterium]
MSLTPADEAARDALLEVSDALARVSAALPPAVRPAPTRQEGEPRNVAMLALHLAVATFQRQAPAEIWKRHAGADEPIYRIAHQYVTYLARRFETDVEVAHANVPGLMWVLHPPHRQLMAKDTHADRTWWADRFREHPYLNEAQPAARPRGFLTLYRGATPDRRDGLTWTPSLLLASRYGPTWVARVPGDALLCSYTDLHTALPAHVIAPEYLADVAPVDVRGDLLSPSRRRPHRPSSPSRHR